jgi:hypothetical protein
VNGSTSQTVENSFIDLARRAGFHDFSLWVYNLNHKKSAINAPLARFVTQYRLWKGPGVNPWNRNLQFSEPQKQSSPTSSSGGWGSENEEPSMPHEVHTESAGAVEAVPEEAIPEQAVTPEELESEQVIDPGL